MKPYACPVCNSRGRVPTGFYNTSGMGTSSTAVDEECRTCNGSGIVWGPSESPTKPIFPIIPDTWAKDPQFPKPDGTPETNTSVNY